MDPWIHGSAAGSAARAAAGAAAGVAASADVCTYFNVIIIGVHFALSYVCMTRVHIAAAAEASAPAAAQAAAPAADPWIHGSISFIMNHKSKKSKIFNRTKNRENGLKLYVFWTKSIASTRIIFRKSFKRTSKRTNEPSKRNKQNNSKKK